MKRISNNNGKRKTKEPAIWNLLGIGPSPCTCSFLTPYVSSTELQASWGKTETLASCSSAVANTVSDVWEALRKRSWIFQDKLGSFLSPLAQKEPMF